mmetsp:Transcript_31148/g.79433  ORF Transcript_31148/g.79433 Transcript_31148/m.79433 type:complete len:212 (+) Transcript_31148:352-987(+)
MSDDEVDSSGSCSARSCVRYLRRAASKGKETRSPVSSVSALRGAHAASESGSNTHDRLSDCRPRICASPATCAGCSVSDSSEWCVASDRCVRPRSASTASTIPESCSDTLREHRQPASAGSAGAAEGASSGMDRRARLGQFAASSCSARPLMKAPLSRGVRGARAGAGARLLCPWLRARMFPLASSSSSSFSCCASAYARARGPAARLPAP